jgi:hypothetical protein
MLKNVFEISLDYNIINHERINVSLETGLQCELTQNNMERLKQFYKKDYEYYNIFILKNITYYQLGELYGKKEK